MFEIHHSFLPWTFMAKTFCEWGGQVTLGFLGPVVTLKKPTFCDQHQAKVWASRVEIKLEDKDHNKQKLKQVEKKKNTL